MKNIKINNNSIIYVLCPAYIKTGGPELLHQLVYELNKNEINAYITYYNYNKENNIYRNNEFDKYTQEFKLIDEIIDEENNILIIPETVYAIKQTKKFKKIKKVIWWLSVDNFIKAYRFKKPIELQGVKNTIKLFFKGQLMYSMNYIKKINFHLCQSKYAIEFLKAHNINNYEYLSDYLNDTYLDISNVNIERKENIVLYNPKKGKKFTSMIIKKSNNLKWIPIQNLTTQQVKELLLKSKVYIDFGNHPGKDRFPREAAMCGCCVITGKRGSAKYYEDVMIEKEFKFEDRKKSINEIIEKIKYCIEDYENQYKKFENYRNRIKNEKIQFEKDVKNIFTK